VHRVDQGAVNPKPDPQPAGVSGFFSRGLPGLGGGTGTFITDDWLNDMQESVAQVIEAAGIALAKGDGTQLLQAIQKIAGGARRGQIDGRMEWVSNTQIRLAPEYRNEIQVEYLDRVGKATGAVVWDITADLAGTEAPSTWLYIYAKVADAPSTTIQKILSPLAPETAGADQGYRTFAVIGKYRCIGAIYNTAAGHIFPFDEYEGQDPSPFRGQQFRARDDASFQLTLATDVTASYQAVALTGRVPAIAKEVLVETMIRGENGDVFYGPESLVGTTTPGTRRNKVQTGVAREFSSVVFNIPIHNQAAPKLAYHATSAVGWTDHIVNILGWR
jgi:hypothetical protein